MLLPENKNKLKKCQQCEENFFPRYKQLSNICQKCNDNNKIIKDERILCKECNRYFKTLENNLCSNCYRKTVPYIICEECGEYKRAYTKIGKICSTCTRRKFKVRRDICCICEKEQFISGTHDIGKICSACWSFYKQCYDVELVRKIRKRKQNSRQIIITSLIKEIIECEEEKHLKYLIPNCPKEHSQKRYDIYIPSIKLIVEVHEEQHYSAEGFKNVKGNINKTYDELILKYEAQKASDIVKKDIALKSNFEYYELNVSGVNGYKELRILFEKELKPYIESRANRFPGAVSAP